MDKPITWYAVRTKKPKNPNRTTCVVHGRREFVVEVILRRRGFEIFLPTKEVFRRKSKYTQKKVARRYPLLVGWVFVGWPTGEDRWHELADLDVVRGVAGIGGRMFCIPPGVMSKLQAKYGENVAPDREQFMPTHYEFDVGDKVELSEGPFADAGRKVEVIELDGPQAKVLVDLLGRETEIWVKAMSLQKTG